MQPDTGLQTVITSFLRVKALQELCFPGSTYYVSGSKDTVYYGTAECSDDTKADEDDRCNELRKENKAKYHLPPHNQVISALSTRICNPESISPQAINDPNVCPGCRDWLRAVGCVSALAEWQGWEHCARLVLWGPDRVMQVFPLLQ